MRIHLTHLLKLSCVCLLLTSPKIHGEEVNGEEEIPKPLILPTANAPESRTWTLSLDEGLSLMLAASHRTEVERLRTEIAASRKVAARSRFEPTLILRTAYADRERRLNQFTTDTNRGIRFSDDIATRSNERAAELGLDPVFENFDGEVDISQLTEEQQLNLNLPDPEDLVPREYFEKIRNSRVGIDWLVPTGTLFSASLIELRRTDDFITELTPNGLPLSPYMPYQQEYLGRISVTQPLLKNFGIKANLAELRLLKAEKSIADAFYFESLSSHTSTFLKNYYRLRLLARGVDAHAESVEAARALLEEANRLKNEGLADIVDTIRQQSLIADRELLWINARSEYYDGQQAVLAMINKKYTDDMTYTTIIPTSPFPVSFAPDPSKSPLDHVREAFGYEYRIPTITVARARIQSAQYKSVILRNEALPKLDLEASYGVRGIGADAGEAWEDFSTGHHPEWQVGITFEMPLGFSLIKGKLREAENELKLAESNLAAEELEFSSELAVLMQRIRYAEQSVRQAQKMVVASSEALRVETLKLQEGKSRVSVARELQGELLLAKLRVLRAQNVLNNTIVDFHTTKGDLLEILGVNIVTIDDHIQTQRATKPNSEQ